MVLFVLSNVKHVFVDNESIEKDGEIVGNNYKTVYSDKKWNLLNDWTVVSVNETCQFES